MEAQTVFPASLLEIPSLPKGRGMMSSAQVLRTLEQIIQVARRLPIPRTLHLSLGDQALPSSLQSAISRYEGPVYLYNMAPGPKVPANVRCIAVAPQSPLRRDWMLVLYTPHWQIAFIASPQENNQPFSILLMQDRRVILSLGHYLEDFEVNFEMMETQHDFTAQLLWRLASDFSDVTPIARGLSNIAIHSGLAWLIIHRSDERWTTIVRAIHKLTHAKRVALYQLESFTQTLIPLQATESVREVRIQQDSAITRASFSNQIIHGHEDGLAVLAMPIIQGEQVWGVLEVERAKPFSEAEFVSLSLIAELARLSLTMVESSAMADEPQLPETTQLNLPPLAMPELKTTDLSAADEFDTLPTFSGSPGSPSSPMPPPVTDLGTYADDDLYWPELNEFERATSTVEVLAVDAPPFDFQQDEALADDVMPLAQPIVADLFTDDVASPAADSLATMDLFAATPETEMASPYAFSFDFEPSAMMPAPNDDVLIDFDLPPLMAVQPHVEPLQPPMIPTQEDGLWSLAKPLRLQPLRPEPLLSDPAEFVESSVAAPLLSIQPIQQELNMGLPDAQVADDALDILGAIPKMIERPSWPELTAFSQRTVDLGAMEDQPSDFIHQADEEFDFDYPLEADLATERNQRQELEQHVLVLQAQLDEMTQRLNAQQEHIFQLETELKIEQTSGQRQSEELKAREAELNQLREALSQAQQSQLQAQIQLDEMREQWEQRANDYEQMSARLEQSQASYAHVQAELLQLSEHMSRLEQNKAAARRVIATNSLLLFTDLRAYFGRLRERLSRLKSSVSVSQVKLLDQILGESGTISTILSEVEQVSRTNSAGLEPLNLSDVVQQACISVSAKVAQQGLSLQVITHEALVIYGHPTSMARAVYNLLMSVVYLSNGSNPELILLRHADTPRLQLTFTPKNEFVGKLQDYTHHFDHGIPHLSALALAREIIQQSGGSLRVELQGARALLIAEFLEA